MTLIEFIGFVISFIAMIVLFFRQAIEKRRRQQDPEKYDAIENRREQRLREFYKALDVPRDDDEEDEEDFDDDEDEYIAPPPVHVVPKPKDAYAPAAFARPQRSVKDGYQFRTKIEQLKGQSDIEKRRLATSIGDSYNNRFDTDNIVSPDLQKDLHHDAYALKVGGEGSRVNDIVGRLNSPADMVILHEIIGPPKAMR